MGISQAALADVCGCARQNMYAFECWRPDEPANSTSKRPTVEVCVRTAKYLKLDSDMLLGLAGHISPTVAAAIQATFWGPLIIALQAEKGDLDAWSGITALAQEHGITPENTRLTLGWLSRLKRAIDKEKVAAKTVELAAAE